MYYIIECEYCGPNVRNLGIDRRFITDGHYFCILEHPGRKNMSGEPAVGHRNSPTWLGTTNDWAEYARGAYETEEEAIQVAIELAEAHSVGYREVTDDEDGLTRIFVGSDTWANLWDTEDWLAEATNEELGIYPSMNDDAIKALAEQLQSDAASDGLRLWEPVKAIEARLEALEEEECEMTDPRLILTQSQYNELADKIGEHDLVRFHLDGSGEFHYPLRLELSDDLEARLLQVCGWIGPDRYLSIGWGGVGLDPYISDTNTKVFCGVVEIKIVH